MKRTKTTHNHAFDLAFAVPNSQYEDWGDCLVYERGKVLAALQERISDIESSSLIEFFEGFDTHEEEN